MIETVFKLPGVTRVSDTVINGQLKNRTLYIDSDYLAECATLWASGKFTELGISKYQNAYKFKDVEFLRTFPPISRFHVYLDRKVNLAPLTHHAGSLIRFFANDGKNLIDDLSPFERLENIGQVWSTSTVFPETMRSLKGMGWSKFNPKTKNLKCLPDAPNLNNFGCVSSNSLLKLSPISPPNNDA